MKMPKNKDEFECLILNAFSYGMNVGYGLEHTNLAEKEEKAIKEYAEDNKFKRKSLCEKN